MVFCQLQASAVLYVGSYQEPKDRERTNVRCTGHDDGRHRMHKRLNLALMEITVFERLSCRYGINYKGCGKRNLLYEQCVYICKYKRPGTRRWSS
jgi:hypothetical protein